MMMFNRTEDAVPSRPLRSHRSSTYCRKRAVSHRQTHGRMSLHRSSGTRDLRKLTCGPRPQSAARSMPCKIPWPARSATVPLSRCTQRDAKARPRPALRANRCRIRSSRRPAGVRQPLQRQLRGLPKKHSDLLGSGATVALEPTKSRISLRATASGILRRKIIRTARRNLQRGQPLQQ